PPPQRLGRRAHRRRAGGGMTKEEARLEVRARLAVLTPGERERAGEEIARRLWSVPAVAAARAILLYASLPGEVPTDAIARGARRRGIVVTYPRCLPDTRAMTLHRLNDPADLRRGGSYGIREPDPACPRLEPGEIDAVLVPGLAWDRGG